MAMAMIMRDLFTYRILYLRIDINKQDLKDVSCAADGSGWITAHNVI